MVTGNESQAGISPHGIEGVLTCHENPPRGFLSLGFMPLAAKLGLRATSNSSITQQGKILEKFMKTEAEAALACLVAG